MTKTQAIKSLLIANRGEIAVRIIRGARALGSRTVAVYSTADAGAPHVALADEAVEIGPAEASQSYLNAEVMLAAARQTGAQAVHPGYGFLAENADFAQAVLDAGLTWVGPTPAAMRAMGDKAGARALMEAAGVPLLPGYQGADTPAKLRAAAEEIGYPLLVKASAGGGGVGMRVVSEANELDEAIKAARRTAEAAFGDGRLLLERYLPRGHHVEVQVLGDQKGNLVHIFERECSTQRRHQKIIEESPSPLLDAGLRAEMGAAAVAAAKAVDYSNAGTVEFLLDPKTKDFYFLEMNTRLQVEHPVTELVTGLDLVQLQLQIAAGEPLPFRQEDLQQTGHSIECRIYAEDPAAGFLPQAGEVLKLEWPQGEGIRVDAGIVEGQTVTSHYDPMLAKLIVWAADRPAAIARMRAALAETVLLGLTTNLEFLQAVLASDDFAAGVIDTAYVDRELAEWAPPPIPLRAVAAAARVDAGPPADESELDHDPYSPWARLDGFRIGGRG